MLGEAGLKHRAWGFHEVRTRPLVSTPLPSALARLLFGRSHGKRGAPRSQYGRPATSHAEGGGSGDVSTQGHMSGLETAGRSDFLVLMTTPRAATRSAYLSPTPPNLM